MKALLLLTVHYIYLFVYIEKDPDAGNSWGQKEKDMAEDEMVR